MYKVYYVVTLLFSLARLFLLPNRFQMAADFPENAFQVLVLAEGIIHAITFTVVSLYYRNGLDNPVKGSILYLVFYFIHTGLFYLVGAFGFNIVAIAIIAALYIAVHIGVAKLKKLLFGGVR